MLVFLIFLEFIRENVPAVRRHKLYVAIVTTPVTMYGVGK